MKLTSPLQLKTGALPTWETAPGKIFLALVDLIGCWPAWSCLCHTRHEQSWGQRPDALGLNHHCSHQHVLSDMPTLMERDFLLEQNTSYQPCVRDTSLNWTITDNVIVKAALANSRSPSRPLLKVQSYFHFYSAFQWHRITHSTDTVSAYTSLCWVISSSAWRGAHIFRWKTWLLPWNSLSCISFRARMDGGRISYLFSLALMFTRDLFAIRGSLPCPKLKSKTVVGSYSAYLESPSQNELISTCHSASLKTES